MILAVKEPGDIKAVAKRYGITPDRVRSWIKAYSEYSPEALAVVTEGVYDSPDEFLNLMQETSTTNFYYQHAIRCRLSGLSTLQYAEEFASVDPLRVEEYYERVKRIPLDQLEDLVENRKVFTPVNYKNLMYNLHKSTKAIHAAAQAETPEPLLLSEIKILKMISADLSWAVERLECSIESIQVEKPLS